MCDVTFVNLNFTKKLEILEPPQHAKKNVRDLQPLNVDKVCEEIKGMFHLQVKGYLNEGE